MRKPFIAGNWKMNLNRKGSVTLAGTLADRLAVVSVDVAVCPPAVYLEAVLTAIGTRPILVGAQNCHDQPKGAFTGEISPLMVRDIGCQLVILGHSERRSYFQETDELIHRKTLAALQAELLPIVCVGEQLSDREAGRTMDVIRSQFTGSLGGLTADQMRRTVIAYEPVWAIGTGKVASPEQAEQVHAALRAMIAETFDPSVAESVRIQYGGSVSPDNAAQLLAQPNIDGALVGGASLVADKFLDIIAAAAKVG